MVPADETPRTAEMFRAEFRKALKTGFFEGVAAVVHMLKADDLWEASSIRKNFDYGTQATETKPGLFVSTTSASVLKPNRETRSPDGDGPAEVTKARMCEPLPSAVALVAEPCKPFGDGSNPSESHPLPAGERPPFVSTTSASMCTSVPKTPVSAWESDENANNVQDNTRTDAGEPPPEAPTSRSLPDRLLDLHQHLGSEHGKMTKLYGDATILEVSLLLKEAADRLATRIQERDELQQENERLRSLVNSNATAAVCRDEELRAALARAYRLAERHGGYAHE